MTTITVIIISILLIIEIIIYEKYLKTKHNQNNNQTIMIKAIRAQMIL